MHNRTAGLGVDQLALPNDLAALIPPIYQHDAAPQALMPQQRIEVTESVAAELHRWADSMQLPGIDT
jgi:hypothetical protein